MICKCAAHFFASFLILISIFFFCQCKKDLISVANFREIAVPVSENLSSVWFTDKSNGFVCGGDNWTKGFILSTADGGEHWRTDTLLPQKTENIYFDSMGNGYACGVGGVALLREKGLEHWTVFRTDYRWHRALFFRSLQYGIIVSGEGWKVGQIRKHEPYWEQDTVVEVGNELDAVWFSDSATAHVAGMGLVMRSADTGKTWERYAIGDDHFLSIHFPAPLTGYICGLKGTLLKTTDGGKNWVTLREANKAWRKSPNLRSLWFVSPQKGYVVGDNGLLWRTENGGADWETLSGPPRDADFTDIHFTENKGWITAKNGRLFCFDD